MFGSSADPASPRITAQPEWPQVALRQVQHADDVGRQRQDDIGLLRLLVVDGEQPADQRQVAQPWRARELGPLVVADQAREHVGLAVLEADRGRDFTIAEGRKSAEAAAGHAAQRQLQRQRDVVVVVRSRRDVDVDADVPVRNDVIGCWLIPPVAMGANTVAGTGTSSPNRACAGSPSDVRSCGLARVRVLASVFSSL